MKKQLRYLYCFILFLALQGNSEIHPITPKDVLTDEEIAAFYKKKDFFMRAHLESDKPLWNHLERKYGHHYLKPRVHVYSLDDVLHQTLSNGFPVRYQIQQLYRAGMNRHIALGNLIPKLSLTVGENMNPLSINNIFVNLFGFLLPQNWFALIQAKKANEATKYLFLKTTLDQYYAAEFLYIDLHQYITDFEIYNFYMIHLQLLDQYLTDNGRHDPLLAANYATVGTDMATQRGNTKLRFDDLAEVMALRLDREGKYAADKLNIAPIEDFPERVQQLEELGEFYKNKEDFITEVLKRSVEMKAVNELYQVARLGIGVTAFGNILSGVNSTTNTYLRMGINFGYDTIPRILTATSLATTAKIDVESQFVQMIELARRAFDNSTNSIGGYTEANRSMKLNRQAFAVALKQIIENDKPVDAYFLRTFSNLMQSEFRLNNALHGTMKAHALMRRLLVTEEKNMMKYLPQHEEVRKIQRFFLANYGGDQGSKSHIDKSIFHVHKSAKLKTFLAGEYINIDGSKDKLSKEEVSSIVSDKMPLLLRKKVFGHRSKQYYSTLNQYVKDNNIFMTDIEKNKLERRAGLPVDKLKMDKSQWLSKPGIANPFKSAAKTTDNEPPGAEHQEDQDEPHEQPARIEKLGEPSLAIKH